MNVGDDLYTGLFLPSGLYLGGTTAGERQNGVGPLGRIIFKNVIPLTLSTTNVATAVAQTANVPIALVAGTGTTAGVAPDGSGRAVIVLDTPRCVSLTSAGDLSGSTITVKGFDQYGQALTATRAGPNANTVNTLKAFVSVLSVTSDTTSATTMSVGTSDIFGLPFVAVDAGYIISAKWAGVLAQNAGTFVVADTTSPATATTGDVRGTFAQSGSASNGTRRLVIAQHLDGTQCGQQATQVALLGVKQA
jgi:hypothetical protein